MGGTGSGVVTLSGAISGTGALSVTGGTWLLSGTASTFSGGLTINNGTVQGGGGDSGIFGSGNVTFGISNTPKLDLDGTNKAIVGLLIGAGSNGIVTSSSGGNSLLTLSGSGTQTFAGKILEPPRTTLSG